MDRLPERPHLSHLKAQAKDLLRSYRRGDPSALARFRHALPMARGRDDAAIGALGLRLRDAQSCVAREYGFASWPDLKAHVEQETLRRDGGAAMIAYWLRLVYGDGYARPQPAVAARLMARAPKVIDGDPSLACAVGDAAAVSAAIGQDAAWANRPGGPLAMPPLVAVTHSALVRLPPFEDGLLRSARVLLDAGADPGQSWIDPHFPNHPLSALYGAAGKNHHPGMTALLLRAGARPDDGESLYHSVEDETLVCTRLLLQAGAKPDGTNAIFRVLDVDNVEGLKLLLSHGADPDARLGLNRPMHHAILRRRSVEHVRALLEAGADPALTGADGLSAHRMALRYGLPEVAAALASRGVDAPLPPEEQWLGACARADMAAAAGMLAAEPHLLRHLSAAQRRLLPDLAQAGQVDAVKVMVRLGWPVDVRGGDWSASALNHAVFRGDVGLTSFLLEHGSSWREEHGYHDNVVGTLAFASTTEPVEGGDWLGCAKALIARGMPVPPATYRFSDDVADYFSDVTAAGNTDR